MPGVDNKIHMMTTYGFQTKFHRLDSIHNTKKGTGVFPLSAIMALWLHNILIFKNEVII